MGRYSIPGQKAQNGGGGLESQGFRTEIFPVPGAEHLQQQNPLFVDRIFRRQVEGHIFPVADVLREVAASSLNTLTGLLSQILL